ncbi:MAG: hypothetical protein ACOYT8_02975 [Candidatus Dependentiae bacterium]
MGDLHPAVKEWCDKNPKCVECTQFAKFIFCAQKRPLPWEISVAEKNDDTQTLSTELFCQEQPWTEKWRSVSTDNGKYVTFDNIYNEVEHIFEKKDGWSKFNRLKALEVTEIIGKKLEHLACEKTYSHADLKKALSYLPNEFSQLCATNVHNRNCGFIVAAFKNPTLYQTQELAQHVIKIGEEQQWSGDQVVYYITQINEAFGKRKVDVIKSFLLKTVQQLPKVGIVELNRALAIAETNVETMAELIARTFHHMMDGNIRKAYYTLKKDFKVLKKRG